MSRPAIAPGVVGVVVLCACSPSCSRRAPAVRGADASAAAAAPPAREILAAIARAEDVRRARDLPPGVQQSPDPAVRRAAARALARILDADDGPLLRALEDDDGEVVAWAAFGLGESCEGREDARVRALAARLASLGPEDRASGEARPPSSPRPAVRPLPALLRALGRCGGEQAERTLAAWIRGGRPSSDAAAYALGDVASRGPLSAESLSALLDAADAAPPLDAALYAIGRAEGAARTDLEPREIAVARAALRRPGAARIFAVRVLGRARDRGAIGDLARILASPEFTAPERVEAANGLGRAGAAGQEALAEAMPALVPDRPEAVEGDRFGVLTAALRAAGDDPPPALEASLWSLARLGRPASRAPSLARRLSQVRCAAALGLARGKWDADVLRACDSGDGEAGERAELASLDRGPLVGPRRAAWRRLLGSAHVRVREAALEIVSRHPELGDAALPAIAQGLAASEPGVVAVAARLVQAHPERVFVLAQSERRAALDPAAPPPPPNPARELDRGVAAALKAALARPWSEDLVETRAALVEAGLAAGLGEGRAFARAACRDANAAVRARAATALAAAGDKDAACPDPGGLAPAPEIGREAARAARVVFDTDAGRLVVRIDPALAPIAATRLLALARSGFYAGITVPRVVPGFAVQLGDRAGDGYGGSGRLLRSETSPVAFGALDVGVALDGPDTGSSQIFVTLARSPRLDGRYAWIGRAEGDWGAVAEGDVVRAVTVRDEAE